MTMRSARHGVMGLVMLVMPVWAQGPPGAAPPKPAPPNAKRAAPFDPSGYWVAQITEDWRQRIQPAKKGDVGGIPLNGAGRRAANAWDPDKDAAPGDGCKAYGVGGLLRIPGRLKISWEDDNLLKLEADAGNQVRWLSFTGARGQAGDAHGISTAAWERPRGAISGFMIGNPAGAGGSLKVVTTQAKPGYLSRNGAPYGSGATFTEYFDLFAVPGGDALLVASVEVTDPEFLSGPYWYSVHFKKQADAQGWAPRACSAK
jgi:hypothetical protein